jgi:predicted RNA methylase
MRVDQEVLNVLANAEKEGNALRLSHQLDRALYVRTDKVLQAAGGKWQSRARAHVFETSAEDAIDQILLTGEVTVPQDFGYFPTPVRIVNMMIALAGLEPGMLVLEPSAGRGAIVAELLQYPVHLSAVELLSANLDALQHCGDARNNRFMTFDTVRCDFLCMEARPSYDRVIMNPPFAKQADIHHVNHALKFLKPTGKLVSVMSAGVRFRENVLSTDFRASLEARDGYFIDLDPGAFKESGTMVNTVIAVFPPLER